MGSTAPQVQQDNEVQEVEGSDDGEEGVWETQT